MSAPAFGRGGLDLTAGSISKGLAVFGVPLLLANLLQCLYGTVDMMILGHYVGGAGMTAASIGGQIVNVMTALSSGLSTGVTVVISQYRGAGREELVSRSVGTLFCMFAIIGSVLTGVLLAAASPLVSLFNTPVEAVAQTLDYLIWSSVGILAIFGYNAVCAVLRGMGDSRGPMWIVALATVLNILLDLYTVGKLDMGAGGAALSTAVSQAASFAVAILRLFAGKNALHRMRRGELRLFPEQARLILRVGLPNAVQVTVVRCSMLVVLTMVNAFGVTAASAVGAGMKVDNFVILPRQALSTAMSTMVGQCMGKGDRERVAKTIHVGGRMSLVLCIVVMALVQLFAPAIVAIFTSEAEVIAEGVRYLRIATWYYLPLALMGAYNALSIGIGFSEMALLNSFLDSIVARCLLCWLLAFPLGMGLTGLYAAIAASPLVAMVSGCLYFYRGNWRSRQLVKKQAAEKEA